MQSYILLANSTVPSQAITVERHDMEGIIVH